jgi:hypothetical protein
MPEIPLRDLCLETVVSVMERFLDLQWSDGRFSTRPEHETEEWNFYDQQFILPAALLHSTEHAVNPWHGSQRLWQAILRNGRHIASRVAEEGSMTWRLHGVVLGSPFVCQRLTCAWLLAYRLLKERLPEADAVLWRATITKACEWLVNRHLIPHRDVVRFTSHDVGTGTNHFSLYLSLVWLAGREFGRGDWVELAADLMRRLIADQRPGGYWEEHQGPALGYNYLTYHGVEEYTSWSGEEVGLEALRRGLDLHQSWTYPDGIPVECIDGRMRHLSGPMVWGLAGFTRWPEGRGYARFLLGRLRERADNLSGETVARVAEAYLLARDGQEAPCPQQRPTYRATLDEASVIRKQGPWMVALSGQCSSPWPENQFCLDRQALVSLWREGAGLVLDGSNSKFQPELATFCRGSGADADHMPLSARSVSSGEMEGVEPRYAGFTARVSARVLDARAFELRFWAHGEGPITLTLVPHVSFGEAAMIQGFGRATLGDDKLWLRPGKHGGAMVFRGIRLHLPPGASIEYPVSPFNSYSADNSSPPSANRLVVRCPVDEKGVALRAEAGE